MTVAFTRRSLLKLAGASALAAGFPDWVSATTKIPEKWDETVDVVVVGSGFAGLAAAYEVKKAEAVVSVF